MLEVRNVEVRYGAAAALRGVSIDVAAGELVCVVGPNGAGKSTLINAIAGMHPVASGMLSFDGRDLTRVAPHRFCAQGIAIVPEGRRLFTRMSVRENLVLGSYRPKARAARSASIERVCALFPVLSEKLDAPAGALSGGQQQMLAIARALMAQPRLLLLDEPSLGLSPLIVQTMFAMIERIHRDGRGGAAGGAERRARARARHRAPTCWRKARSWRATRRMHCASSRTSGAPTWVSPIPHDRPGLPPHHRTGPARSCRARASASSSSARGWPG